MSKKTGHHVRMHKQVRSEADFPNSGRHVGIFEASGDGRHVQTSEVNSQSLGRVRSKANQALSKTGRHVSMRSNE